MADNEASLTEQLKIQDNSSSLKRRYVITSFECIKYIVSQINGAVPIILVVENEGTSFFTLMLILCHCFENLPLLYLFLFKFELFFICKESKITLNSKIYMHIQ